MREIVPVIDIGALRGGDSAAMRELARQIGAAAREIGFFSVVNHGVSAELIDAVFAQSMSFFALQFEAKERIAVETSLACRGYARNGYEKFNEDYPADAKESFDMGPDQNIWPRELVTFRPVMETYYNALLSLTIELHRSIAIDLNLDERFFDAAYDRAIAILRLLYYPPNPNGFDGRLHGAAPHTDYGNITFLAQDDTGGLELQMRDGTWIGVTPTPGAFVCNIGDCLMRWSNDIYVSNPHRVVNRSERSRYSIAFFGDPAGDARVECLPTCSDDARPPKYAPTTYGEYLKERLAAAYPTKAMV